MKNLQVVSAGFSHLKGTRHAPRTNIEITERGLTGDRELCLIDPVKKRVLRTVQNSALMAVTTEVADNQLTVTFPDNKSAGSKNSAGKSYTAPLIETGETIICDYWGRDEPVHPIAGQLSEVFTYYLRRPVQLVRAQRNVVYGQTLTIIGTASLEELGARTGLPLVQQAGRFRASLLVETDEPFIEETWAGQIVQVIGENLARDYTLTIGEPVPRCAVIDFNPTTGIKDARLLKTLTGYRSRNAAGEPSFGVFATLA